MKLAILEQKFDEIRAEGLLLKSALSHNGQDEADNIAPPRPTKLVKRTVSATLKKPQTLDVLNAASTLDQMIILIFEQLF